MTPERHQLLHEIEIVGQLSLVRGPNWLSPFRSTAAPEDELGALFFDWGDADRARCLKLIRDELWGCIEYLYAPGRPRALRRLFDDCLCYVGLRDGLKLRSPAEVRRGDQTSSPDPRPQLGETRVRESAGRRLTWAGGRPGLWLDETGVRQLSWLLVLYCLGQEVADRIVDEMRGTWRVWVEGEGADRGEDCPATTPREGLIVDGSDRRVTTWVVGTVKYVAGKVLGEKPTYWGYTFQPRPPGQQKSYRTFLGGYLSLIKMRVRGGLGKDLVLVSETGALTETEEEQIRWLELSLIRGLERRFPTPRRYRPASTRPSPRSTTWRGGN